MVTGKFKSPTLPGSHKGDTSLFRQAPDPDTIPSHTSVGQEMALKPLHAVHAGVVWTASRVNRQEHVTENLIDASRLSNIFQWPV